MGGRAAVVTFLGGLRGCEWRPSAEQAAGPSPRYSRVAVAV